MKVSYQTKKESNEIQEREFLALSPHERVMHFLRLSEQISHFKTKANSERAEKNNFIIEINHE